MPTHAREQEKIRQVQELRIWQQIAFASGLFQGDVTVRTLLESLAEGCVIIDTSGTILLVNARAEQMFGYPNMELIGKPHAILIPERFHKVHEEYEAQIFGEPRNRSMGEALNLAGRRQDESEFPIAVSLSFIKTINGVLALALVSDITIRKQFERRLQETAELFHIQTEWVKGYAIFTLDAKGNVLNWNAGAEHLQGYQAEEIIGKHFSCFYPEEDRTVGTPEEELKKATAEGQTVNVGSRIRKDGSSFWAEVRITALYDERGELRGFSKVTHDITELKRVAVEKIKLEDQLQQAQKMESVGRLAGGVAHDFNNMLSVIIGHANLALMDLNPTQQLHVHLEEIRKAAERSAGLTRQLLAFARKQTVAPKVLNLNETVAGTLTMLKRLIGENIALDWLPGVDLWTVKIDPSQIDQILANLCVNACDSISGVGKLIIETANSSIDVGYCAHHAGFVPGEYVRLSVSDNGCGMDKETLSHIFEPFFTTKSVGEGTGLGLATVYGAVKQNNGFINVYSEPGLGTTFTIYLPQHGGKVEQARTEGATEPAQRGEETILLVEDEPAFLNIATMILTRQGYTVLAANSPGEAIRLAEEFAGEISLLVTDVVMPEMNGRDLVKNLLSINPHLKRLFMSGYTYDVIAHHGVLDEGVPFIQKPFTMTDLAAKVREVLDSK